MSTKRKRESNQQPREQTSSGNEDTYDERTKLILKVRDLMNQREQARKDQNFQKSDGIREVLSDLGVEVIDQKNGPSGWKFKDGSSKNLPNNVKLAPKPQQETSSNENTRKKAKISGASQEENDRNKQILKNLQPKLNKNQRNVQGVLIEDVLMGQGEPAKNGDKIKVYYTGRLKSNNKVFDSSTSKPFAFTLGKGEVIRGWDIGCLGMCVGGKRLLSIPAEKAYGRTGAPPTIPANAALNFEVVIVDIVRKKKRL